MLTAARLTRLLCTPLTVLAAGACGDSDGGRPAPVVRDSAGVAIVEFDAPSQVDTIAGPPRLTLGTEGDPDLEFFRLLGVVPLASGNLVAINSGTSELRFFAPDGAHLRTVGRPGDGPEEFGFLSTAWLGAGDTLRALDPRRRRIVTFDSAGTFVRGASFAADLPPNPPGGLACFAPGVAGVLSGGARLVRGGQCFDFRGSDGVREMRFALSIADEERTVSLGDFAHSWYWERGSPDSPADRYDFLPLTAATLVEVNGSDVWMSDGREYALQRLDSLGGLRSIFRERAAPPDVTVDIRGAHAAELAENGGKLESDVPYPDRLGAYDRLVIDPEGEVWARRTPVPGAAPRWSVFDPGGPSLRQVVLPDGQLAAVRGGLVYLITADELGIQQIRVYGRDPHAPS